MAHTKTKKKARAKQAATEAAVETPAEQPIIETTETLIAPESESPPPAAPEPDLEHALSVVMEMMAIRGGSGKEKGVADFIVSKLRRAGVDEAWIEFDNANEKTPLAGDTGNLILKLPGTIEGPRRLLTAHMDTVPICIGSQPQRDGDYVRSADPATGLGADDRAGATTILSAALEILERKLPHPPLTFCWFIQEEIGLYGARHVDKDRLGNPELAFNWDGGITEKLSIGATGGWRMEIHVEGIASHAGVAPQRGVSAIAIASLAIADLHRDGWHGAIKKGKKIGTSNVGIIRGGEATNVVTDHVYVKAEARSHNPKFREKIVAKIEKAFKRAAKEVRNETRKRGSVWFNGQLDYEAFRLPDDEPCVLAAQRAVQSIGREPRCELANGGLDANWLYVHGIHSVTLGCGQVNPHMTSEALDIAAFQDACRIALRLATANEGGSNK